MPVGLNRVMEVLPSLAADNSGTWPFPECSRRPHFRGLMADARCMRNEATAGEASFCGASEKSEFDSLINEVNLRMNRLS